MEELEDMLSRNVTRMSTESDTAAYLWGRQRPLGTIREWRDWIKWDRRVFKGWKERPTLTSRKPSTRTKQAQEANTTEDFVFRITGQRPVGPGVLVVSRSKLW